MSLNPNLKEFLEEQPEGKTLLGFYWAMLWRWVVGWTIAYVIVLAIIFITAAVFSSPIW